MKKYIFIIVPIFILTSCGSVEVSNSSIEITPGCRMYEVVRDGGWSRSIYTTICDTDKQEQTSYTESCGKSCAREVQVKTIHNN